MVLIQMRSHFKRINRTVMCICFDEVRSLYSLNVLLGIIHIKDAEKVFSIPIILVYLAKYVSHNT
jgi:hypothetical protein